ncbi:MAG: flavin reductase [Flavobacteriaceae bacterium]|nr:flavin reductase [Flavobacteriaceae bacterium]
MIEKRIKNLVELNIEQPVWDHMFTVAPLVVIGTKERDHYDLAPKHMATPLGFDNYFGFVCTPSHATYNNIKETGEFVVSFPKPDQVLLSSLTAMPRTGELSKSDQIIKALPTRLAPNTDALFIEDSYLFFECDLHDIIDGFGENSIIAGKITSAYIDADYLKQSDGSDQEQLYHNPLLAYVAIGRYAIIRETFSFPFPKNFKR